MEGIPVFRIKNQNDQWLVEYVHDPKTHTRVAIWSHVEERGFPVLSEDACDDMLLILQEKHGVTCEVVKGIMPVMALELMII